MDKDYKIVAFEDLLEEVAEYLNNKITTIPWSNRPDFLREEIKDGIREGVSYLSSPQSDLGFKVCIVKS